LSLLLRLFPFRSRLIVPPPPQSTFIGRAGTKNKGRISRFLANKCSIASRIDCFSDAPSTKFGEVLRGQVEERLAFYETGSNPMKNADAMKKVHFWFPSFGARRWADEIRLPGARLYQGGERWEGGRDGG
jgi:hypothetical protein